MAQTLRGMRHVSVTIENLSPAAIAVGADTTRLRTVVELYLREHGIPVTQQVDSVSGNVYVNVQVQMLNYGPVAVAVHVDVSQPASLFRNHRQMVIGTTWDRGSMQMAGSTAALGNSIEEQITRLLDDFANDFLAANPTHH